MRFLAAHVLPLAVALLMMASPATARTWNIYEHGSGDAPTVQAGIDSAAAGDTVLVYPGTYNEAIVFRGRDIVLRSTDGPETTILDGTGLGKRVVGFGSGETRATIIEGFTVTRGVGGIIIINAEPSVIGNVVTGNGPVQNGGGIWCGADNFITYYPLIQENTISDNQANNLAGGVGFLQWMVPEILNNYVANNEARDGDGGGIYYTNFDDGAVIRGNTVLNNHAGDHGGGIYVGDVGDGTLDLEVSWNLIAGNRADGREGTGDSGGGLWLWEADASVHHNTIVENEGYGAGSPNGGGVAVLKPSNPVLDQNIIAFSEAGGGIWCDGIATPTIRNNLAWQNTGGDGVGACPDWWQSDGNVVADPLFCDLSMGDYSLSQKSPAMTHPAGPLGAISTPGCDIVPVMPTTWGRIKAMYGRVG